MFFCLIHVRLYTMYVDGNKYKFISFHLTIQIKKYIFINFISNSIKRIKWQKTVFTYVCKNQQKRINFPRMQEIITH